MLLRVGHDGIFEMTVDGKTVYSNGSECGVLPTEAEIFKILDDRATAEREGGAPR